MKIKIFDPVTDSDYPEIKEKKLFEAIGPVQRAVKDLTKLAQRLVGLDNLNETVLQKDLTPNTWEELSVEGITGPPKGFLPILVDYKTGDWSLRGEIVDDSTINVYLKITPDAGTSAPSAVTVRIWVKGS